ncbi:MAG: SnoaL-like domain-containing protein [Glomeribacter sp. 1016415]|uniref:Uncharacterized protein n=1 Tax=Mycoavidus cysteinexigens TaxID=1553431 RepID=A0A2Z6EXE1_9BURK|nr:nuclear transport factor 2 family protein [Mycoavidus cysteinexigens]MCX8566440.1 SnoaL-like domain-containing protein [Glomeribacter sp. 1016415]BBE10134.1 Uncharacterized protein MCB1EB_1973 [Mycoavidus cysteinexigens]GAM53518.1 alternative dihydrofolate reductase 3 [bacterium endosymbiont of Mortierella elongata FMR23-6]GLR00550.1 hypothetical protein GCM10007934_03610 [Mycoavidus cysteinexigens]
MPSFTRPFDTAIDTLRAYYHALAESRLEDIMALWVDEDATSLITANGILFNGLDTIRSNLAQQFEYGAPKIQVLDTRSYESPSTAIYIVTEAHNPLSQDEQPKLVLATYVLVQECGKWRIAHIHASAIPERTAESFANGGLQQNQGPLH